MKKLFLLLITTLATPVKSVPLTATPLYVKMLTVKSVVGAWEIDTVYGVVVSPSITDAGPEILTNAVWASGFVGAVSSLIVVSLNYLQSYSYIF